VRARLLALLAALAVLAGACASVPGNAVATVNGEAVSYERFERIVSTQAEGIGLSARDASAVQAAFDSGLVDRQALDEALVQELQRGDDSRITAGPPLEVEDELVDELYEQQVGDGDLDAQLSEVGLSERRFREVFERLVRFEIRGLQLNQGQTGFPIDRSSQLAGLQQSVIQQLVQAEIARQAVEELDLEVDPEARQEIEEQYRTRFVDQETLEAALEDAGYTLEDFEELFVLTQARQQAIQQVEDPSTAQAFFEGLDVKVADRFGSWDVQQGQVQPPSAPV
jgi:hypothetical protein